MAFQHILVPVDFSEPSLKALDLAVRLAEGSGARLTLMYVAMLPSTAAQDLGLTMLAGRPMFQEYADSRRLAVSKQLEELRMHRVPQHIGCELLFREGVVDEVVSQRAEASGHDLIVLGTRGRRAEETLMGSTTRRVMHRSKVPVMVTH
jgi:nucleotide-binding universal stress UspA family protein